MFSAFCGCLLSADENLWLIHKSGKIYKENLFEIAHSLLIYFWVHLSEQMLYLFHLDKLAFYI